MTVNDYSIIVTLPIPLSAQDPEHFNIKKAILESPLVVGFYKLINLNETMNLWYKIRAALAKPAQPLLPPHGAIATISNGKHFTTFDGQSFSLKGKEKSLVKHNLFSCRHQL